MAKIIKNRVKKTGLVDWKKVKDLQPPNTKIQYNFEALVSLIKKHGIAKASDVWEDPKTGDIFWVDGHTRQKAFKQLIKEGYKIPAKIHAVYVNARSREDAIKLLIEVHNIKQNPINQESLYKWLEVEEIDIETIEAEVIHIEEVIPEMSKADMKKFFKKDKNEKGEVFYKFTLKYSEEQYNEMLEKVEGFDGTKEELFYTLLLNQE